MDSKKRGIYGILPYICPEVLNENTYTAASDIYSFGIIMWEILYGKPVYHDQEFDLSLQMKICNGLRPEIIIGTSQSYANLMMKFWKEEQKSRPSAAEICRTFAEWQNDESILSELTKSEEILKHTKNTSKQTYYHDTYISKFFCSKDPVIPDNM